jgi:hypothetical protein
MPQCGTRERLCVLLLAVLLLLAALLGLAIDTRRLCNRELEVVYRIDGCGWCGPNA